MSQSPETISPDYPFEANYVEVFGSKMHYVDTGKGDPVLFLHGNPTSSYLWRNIIPHLSPHARCIAPDLIGMGKSDKPDIDYRFPTHYKYLAAFIKKLELDNITLVIHDWGSALGFYYAFQNEERIKGIAFMEAVIKPVKWSEFPKQMKSGFKLMRTPGIGWLMISGMNMFVKQILPQAIIRKMSKEEMAHYLAPYPSPRSRKPLRQWPCEIPIDGKPADVHQMVRDYHDWLKKTPIPKLFFYAKPGAIIRKKAAEWVLENFPNTEGVFTGKGLHFIQEDTPHLIGKGIRDWYLKLS